MNSPIARVGAFRALFKVAEGGELWGPSSFLSFPYNDAMSVSFKCRPCARNMFAGKWCRKTCESGVIHGMLTLEDPQTKLKLST